MDSGVDGFSGSGPGTGTSRETVVCPEEAAKPSPNSGELSAARRGPKRRVKAGANSLFSNDLRSGTGGPGRVLRDRTSRGAVAHKTSQSKNDIGQKKPENLRRRRGGPTGLLSKPTDAMDTMKKKPTAKKATLLSKSSKGIQGPATRAPRATPVPVCKTEPDTEATSCGVEMGALKGNNEKISEEDVPLDEDPPFKDNPNDLIYKPGAKKEKSRQRPTLKQKEEKKEKKEKGSEKEDEENEIKKEESPTMAVKTEDEMGDDIEPPRKRGRRRKDDKTPRLPKRRKKPPVQYVRCDMEGCGTILAHPRYLQHHIKYQHLLKKKYVCNHPSCGRLFRLQKQLLRHAKHHTDQRDYICEFCARAFKSAHNLAVHRMIHTGEKPIQCEICGFTCRQKASLNWHMKKHDADTFYQFSCSICGKKFEKKDCVVAHKAKSHPEVLIAEALAANAGTLITTPAPVLEAVPGVMSPTQPSASQENQEALGGTLTSLQQVVLPLVPQTQIDLSQGQLLQLAPHHMVQLRQEQETSTLLHLTTATTSAAGHLSNTSHPQLIQLTTLPAATTTTSMAAADSQSTLLTLSSVATLAPQQAVEWVREADGDAQSAGDLWERVVQGRDQDVGEMMWEGDGERRKEDGGIVWEGERQILLDSAEVHGDSLI